jgi:pimeloyl-ACP methyl ester carboxylesterase
VTDPSTATGAAAVTAGPGDVPIAARPRVEGPDWFETAIAELPAEASVEVDGCPIHYLRWGDPARPALVLVHGGGAHARWWSPVAPLLAREHLVLAIDLSGHGDSGHRDRYGTERWADEVLAVVDHAGVTSRPIVIGHSMGGFVTITLAALHGDRLDGAVIVDSPVRRPDPEVEEGQRGRMFRNPKTYPDLDAALDRFVLVPPQPCDNEWIVDFIARHSLRRTDTGWTWKFDRRVFDRDPEARHEHLSRVSCRVAVLHGELSAIVTPDVSAYMDELLGRTAPFVEIPRAHHHVPLDQPLALVSALRALLADWEHTIPRHQR